MKEENAFTFRTDFDSKGKGFGKGLGSILYKKGYLENEETIISSYFLKRLEICEIL